MSLPSPETELHFLRDFRLLHPDHDLLRNVGLVCFDAENVVVRYGSSRLLPGVTDTVACLNADGINTIMLTNMSDGDRAEAIAGQLRTEVIYKGCWADENDETDYGMPSKTHPEMYKAALNFPGVGKHGTEAVMVDDQLKNLRGARAAGLARYLWTFPNGLKQHPGVAAGRVFEVPIGFGLIAAQNLRRLRNGTYGEW